MDTTILVGISLILATILAFLVFRRKSKQQGITKPNANKPAANSANNKSQPSKQPSQQAKPSTAKPKPKKPQSKPKPKENTENLKELNEKPKLSSDHSANQPIIEPDTLEQLFRKVYVPTKYERLQQQSDSGNNQYYVRLFSIISCKSAK